MAGFFSPFAIHHCIPGSRRPGTAHLRIALALAVSAIIHAWLAAGMAVEAPQRPLPPAAHALTAELERVTDSTAADAKPEYEVAPADAAEPLLMRAHAQRLTEGFLPASQRSKTAVTNREIAAVPTAVAALPLPPATDVTYYPARELDVYPAPQAPLRFEYPERAAHEHVGGSLRIMLLLDEGGAIDSMSVIAAEPRGYFEDSTRAVFAAARFFPGRKDGRAVKSRVLVDVNYDPAAEEGVLR
jgi:protein TonB